MSDQYWLTKAQLKRIEPFFPQTRGIPRMDDQRVVSGIIHVIRNGLGWRDAPTVYGPHKTLYNRFVRWSRMVSSTESSPALRPRAAHPTA
ncbi:Mobile element protein [uncultured Synechococcales cyanobacterium]|uniref:Mobile element protein n=1 Tax=uncultured Synechococcales cyanobacterium TaxID=1936017 RepID=A0A6J4VAJ3_9CYAN|nr:Mobile element protein [uncultured Synechococcales cyanobacterium]